MCTSHLTRTTVETPITSTTMAHVNEKFFRLGKDSVLMPHVTVKWAWTVISWLGMSLWILPHAITKYALFWTPVEVAPWFLQRVLAIKFLGQNASERGAVAQDNSARITWCNSPLFFPSFPDIAVLLARLTSTRIARQIPIPSSSHHHRTRLDAPARYDAGLSRTKKFFGMELNALFAVRQRKIKRIILQPDNGTTILKQLQFHLRSPKRKLVKRKSWMHSTKP